MDSTSLIRADRMPGSRDEHGAADRRRRGAVRAVHVHVDRALPLPVPPVGDPDLLGPQAPAGRRPHRRLSRRVRRARPGASRSSRPSSAWSCCQHADRRAVQGAYSEVGIPLNVHAIAIIKLSTDPPVVDERDRALPRRGRARSQQVAKETLEGHLRGVLATLTPEEVNQDRLKFADSLAAEVEQDLAKLGLQLDVLKIQHVTDDANYLESIGRQRIAQVLRDAEIAESNARNEAAKEAAAAEMRAEVAMTTPRRRRAASRTSCARSRPRSTPRRKCAEERAEQAGWRRAPTPSWRCRRCAATWSRCACRPRSSSPPRSSARPRALAAAGQAAPIAEDGERQRRVAAPGRRRVEGGRPVGAGHVPASTTRGDLAHRRRQRRRRSSSGRCS